ncbi:hypothetical protein Q3G72_012018 [Acer saccharum]|nr:hypothetical protein Q3G72_012018 [Acer saccharum]
MAEPTAVQVKEKIDLSDTEKDIFDTLLKTLRDPELSGDFKPNTVLRVAGGWVRDKLLGKECCDIDIALDIMSGTEFANKVAEYKEVKNLSAEEKKKYLSATDRKPPAGVGIIESNPDKSKHLETARMMLFGLWIDFVNLRCEEYSENSRIPTMKFGTAKEDAYRRDLTINSLFYNINTNSVEDLTGRGIEDLKSGKIVTPLPPKATFLDDPLRVLRAIRFGSRFVFILDEELKKAATSDEVKTALAAKISRERIGIEIDLMISGNQPIKAMTYICDLTLFWIVFNIPPKCEPTVSEGCNRGCLDRLDIGHGFVVLPVAWLSAAYLDAAWNLIQLIGCSSFSDEQRRLSLYAALFLPFRKNTYKVNTAKEISIVNYIFRVSLKLKASDAETVINIHRASDEDNFLSLIPSLVSANNDVSELRVLTGSLLRKIKDFWRVALLISTLLYPIDVDCTQDILGKNFQLAKRRDLFMEVENAIIKLGLEKVWDVKPLVNGKEIMNVLQLKSGGPLVRKWQQELLEWQLAHPSGTAEECLDWMKKTHLKRKHSEDPPHTLKSF